MDSILSSKVWAIKWSRQEQTTHSSKGRQLKPNSFIQHWSSDNYPEDNFHGLGAISKTDFTDFLKKHTGNIQE